MSQRLIILHGHSRGSSVLRLKVPNSPPQEPQFKLERGKLTLVTSSDEPYYYYYGESSNGTIDNNIATIGCMPQNLTRGQDVRVYDYDTCSIEFKPPESGKVLIDPKDIVNNQNVSLILENLKTSPDNRLKIRAGENFFKESRFFYTKLIRALKYIIILVVRLVY